EPRETREGRLRLRASSRAEGLFLAGNVIGRDGTCVITPDLVSNCAACHIIPHAKGSHVRPYQ
ncbi:hypothetical protein AX15_006678, partial [Amanita polypyramis BW_CC]